ncbi:MAG: hypothetical protein ACE37F_08860 [Nannocystaceae bacterium]|nr:hypothetical protein [bacterium]
MWPLLLLAPLFELEWEVPDTCPSRDTFLEMVEAQARVQAESDTPAVLRASVAVEERGRGRWALTLQLRRGDELDVRTMDGESCEAVVDAAAVIVSLRLVEWTRSPPPPFAAAPQPVLEPPPRLPMLVVPEPEPGLEPEPEPEPEPSSSGLRDTAPAMRGGWLGVYTGLALGIAPGLGGAVSLDGGLSGRWWRAGLAAEATPRRLTQHPNDARVRGRFDLVVGKALGCGVPRAGPVEFSLCGRVGVGGLRAVGAGNVAQPEPAWRPWFGLGGSASASWSITERLAPTVMVEGLAPLQSRTFSVGRVPGILHETGAFALRAWVGLEIHL